MTPFFDRLDLAPDAVFLLWVAGDMVGIGLVIGAYMAGKRAGRWVAMWLWATRDRRSMNDKVITDLIFGRPTRPPRQPFEQFWAMRSRKGRQ